MFLDNKYTKTYYRIIDYARSRNHIKKRYDSYQKHHIVPRCIGGTNDVNNLVTLTYKEHRVCHCLLIKMQTTSKNEHKMRHAYGFFNKNSKFNGPRYKRGKDNIFSTPEIIEQVRKRMTENNPMKDPLVKEKVMQLRASKKSSGIYRKPRVLKDKFITPAGIFKTKKEIQKILNIPEWTLNTIYSNLDAFPITNGRSSKKIDHLNIDYSKTWKENGFGLI